MIVSEGVARAPRAQQGIPNMAEQVADCLAIDSKGLALDEGLLVG